MDDIGILDYKGINKNPLNDKEYSDKYKFLAEIWSKLPAYKDNKKIIETIKKNNVILVESSTGSGKTVLLPKYTLHALDYKGNVAVTLPKKDMTLSSAKFSAETLDVALGEEVGYQFKGNSKFSDKTKLLYATDGTIVSRLIKNPMIPELDAIIIDEAHERKVQIDLLLFLLKETLKLRKDFKVIIMSATINVELFKNYYSDFKFKNIKLSGDTHYPITSYFIDKSTSYANRINRGFEILLEILEKIDNERTDEYNDILFFITSQNEAFNMCKRLNNVIMKENENKKCKISCHNKILCLELFAGADNKKKELALSKNYKNLGYTIKIIFTTNVAESSLTIDTVKYVIDSGYELNDSFDPLIRANKLDKKLITRAQATQRMGRAGRTGPGICYHLYTREEYETLMDKYPKPAILTSDITSPCLKILSLSKNINKLKDMINGFIEPPTEEYLNSAIDYIRESNFITNDEINEYGELVVNLLDEPQDSKAFIIAKYLNCSREVLKILALTNISKNNMSSIFRIPFDSRNSTKEYEQFLNFKKKNKHKYGDYLSLLYIFNKFIKNKSKIESNTKNEKERKEKLEKWCKDHYLKCDTFRKALKEYKNIRRKNIPENFKINEYIKFNIDKIKDYDLNDKILITFIISHNIATRNLFNDVYSTVLTKRKNIKLNITIDKNSFVSEKGKDMPKKIVYKILFIAEGIPNMIIVSKIPKKYYEYC